MSNQPDPPRSIGPYEIDLLLGTGGMGEVYKAYDPRLDRWVAVKHIRPEYALKDGYRQRLEREARTIASLDHPSVVQIFDILRDDDGGEWIVMELVDGPTVYDMLDNGPLDLGTTLTVALDVIHGLAKAHEQGVLHRDLKSENVMVSRSGVAKILDFGLSKRLEAAGEPTLSVEGKVIGTCRVMAPEQADGQELDGRADLFAFGVLLYEMVTARSPFRASTPVASMLKAFGEPHASVLDYNPEVPEELANLIDWLLTKNRDLRPQNAHQVATKLAEIAAEVTDDPAELAARIRMASRSWHGSDAYPLPGAAKRDPSGDPLDDTVPGGPSTPRGSSRPSGSAGRAQSIISRAAASRAVEETMERSRLDLDGRRAHAHSESRWSSMFSTAFGLGLPPSRRFLAWTAWLMVFVTGWWGVASMTRPFVPEEPEDARIVVLPFENHGPDEMDFFAAGLTSEIIRELTSRRGLAVVSFRTSSHYGTGERSLDELREELDVSHVLEGDIASERTLSENGRMRINLRLIRVDDGRVLLSRSLDRYASDTLQVQGEIADDISLELGAQVFADARRDLSAKPRALEAFFRGLEIVYGTGYLYEKLPEAERYFETSAAEDPDFVRAWTELTRVRSLMIFNGLAGVESRDRAARALAKAEELSPGAADVLLARGYFHYHALQDLKAAAEVFERVSAKSPDDPEVRFAEGLVLRRLGRLEEAIESLQAAFDLDRANGRLAWFIAETERGRRAYARSERWFATATRAASKLPMAVTERAENALARARCGQFGEPPRCDTKEARRILNTSAEGDVSSLWLARVHLTLFEMAADERPEDFLQVFDSAEEADLEDNHRFLVYWRKVLALRALGRSQEARSMAERYTTELEQLASSGYWLHYAALGMSLALQEKAEEADAAMERAFESVGADEFTGPRLFEWKAAISVLLDRPEEAVRYLRQAARTDYQKSIASYEIHADPIWESLRRSGALDDVWEEIRRTETNHRPRP